MAEIREIGQEVKNVRVGDDVIFREYATVEVKVDGEKFLIAKEEDVLAKVEK